MSRTGSDAGFTLVEVVVALAVTAFLLAIILPPIVTARGRERTAQQRIDAIDIASELVAEAQSGPLDESVRQGRDGAVRWRVEETALARDPRGTFALARIAATVEPGTGGGPVVLVTRKLKPVLQ